MSPDSGVLLKVYAEETDDAIAIISPREADSRLKRQYYHE